MSLWRACTFSRQGTVCGPRNSSNSSEFSDGSALRDIPCVPQPRRQHCLRCWRGHTGGGAAREGTPSGSASGRAALGPGDRSGRGRRGGARALGRKEPGRPGGEERGRALTCSWRRAARGAWAEGRRGPAPRRPGPAAPAPSARARGALAEATFCARRAPRLRDPERGGPRQAREAASGRGAAGEGRRLGRFAAPPPHSAPAPLRLLSPTSPFPPRAPALLLGPSMTHRSPRVPPSISLPSPKRDAPSTTSLCLLSPCLSAGGLGVKGLKGLGEGSLLQNFQLLIPLVSSQKPGNSASHLPTGAPQPLRNRPQSASRCPHVVPGCRLPSVTGTSLSVLYQTRLGFPFLARCGHPPTCGLREFRGK